MTPETAADIIRRILREQGHVPPDPTPEQRCAPPTLIDKLRSSTGVPL